MYCMMYSLYVHSMVQLPWITYIHKTICSLGLNYVWVLEGRGISVNMLKALVHQISLDQFIQKWRLELTIVVNVCGIEFINKILD